MAPFTTGTTAARTGAISVTAVLSATGLLATPAHAGEHHSHTMTEAAPVTSSLALIPASIERALAPAAAPVVIAAAAPAAAAASAQVTHTVVRGDTVWDLARHYGSTVTAIIDANSLDSRATIHLGDVLVIPGAATGAATKASSAKATKPASTATTTYTVAAGDTVWDISKRYATSVAAIVSANGLGSDAVIHVGEQLTIPGASASAIQATTTTKVTTASGKTSSTTASSRYTVKAGDTLSAIASRFGTTVAKIAAAKWHRRPLTYSRWSNANDLW